MTANGDRSSSYRSINDSVEANPDFALAAYDYELPSKQIAQNPAVPRDSSRLLVVTSPTNHRHQQFKDLPDLLQPRDLLVFNNTSVIPARLYGQTQGGVQVEALLLEEAPPLWLALVKPGRRLKPGTVVEFGEVMLATAASPFLLKAEVVERDEATGGRWLQFNLPAAVPLVSILHQIGQIPLPPYITDSDAEAAQYQTVYATTPGSAAAPTAGLHFTPELLTQLQAVGVELAFVTLHVGVGTFRPVDVEDIRTHTMHGEWLEVSPTVVEQIQQTQARGGRVIAVGTTAARSLEAAAQHELQPFCDKTELFIYPGYRWRVVQGLITNFHLPKSSLLMLVSALIGRSRLLALYHEAIDQQYRFYSFGDAMLILPTATLQMSA